MKNVLHFVVWPAVAGLAFALVLLQAPRIAALFPGLLPADSAAGSGAATAPDFSTLSFNTAIRKAVPAVVSINNLQLINRPFLVRLTPNITGFGNRPDETSTLGSGVIISPEGYIVTSYHVMFNPELEIIRPEVDINITLNDGRTAEARVIFLDASEPRHRDRPHTGLLRPGDVAHTCLNVRPRLHLGHAKHSAWRVGAELR